MQPDTPDTPDDLAGHAPRQPAPASDYDAVIVVSFGGPDGVADVLPFLQNVTRGRDVPAERLAEVAAHYERFGGKSPINDLNRALIASLRSELDAHGHQDLPIYWGNRNWHPFLADTVATMAADGRRRALAFVTSAYSSYSSCRQYLDDLAAAVATVGPAAPRIDKLRAFFNHPGFIEPQLDAVRRCLDELRRAGRGNPHLLFCAHSVPVAMAIGCDYQAQLAEAAALVVGGLDGAYPFELVWQSRSGPPQVPWLEPDVNDRLRSLAAEGVDTVVLVPVGFVADHLEVVYDLDVMAQETASELGMQVVRAATAGTDPRFVTMVRQLIEERLSPGCARLALGSFGPRADVCEPGCCPLPGRPPPGRPPAGRPPAGRPPSA